MASKIEWTDDTWNPMRGCSRCSPGCAHCYAEVQARRHDHPGGAYEGLTVMTKKGARWSGEVRPIPQKLDAPLHWRKPRRVFVNSMSDLFHEDAPNEYIAAVFGVMAACEHHTFQVLTKRAKRMREWFRWVSHPHAERPAHMWMPPIKARIERACLEFGGDDLLSTVLQRTGSVTEWPLRNVWLGVSVEDQERADERLPELFQCPAARRFVSAEPLLGPVKLTQLPHPNHGLGFSLDALDWLIVGGESGSRARVCKIEWARDLVAQCQRTGVACFVKQLGALPLVRGTEDVSTNGWGPFVREQDAPDGEDRIVLFQHSKGGDPEEWPHDLRVREFPAPL